MGFVLQADLFPHLVQNLRCEQPNRTRSYIKAIAASHALMGRVHWILRQMPGQVDDMPAITPFDMHNAPIEELIRKAKAQSPPDPTGARFGITDAVAIQE